MIILHSGVNSPVFTLTEKFGFFSPPVDTYPDLYYYFILKNELTDSEIVFTSNQDQSLSPERYNEFVINIYNQSMIDTNGTASIDPYNASIAVTGSNYDYKSQWEYEVWACAGPMPLTGTISLPTGASYSPAKLERGKMLFDS